LFMIAGTTAAADDADNKKFLRGLEGAYKMTAAETAGESPAPPGFFAAIDKVMIKGNKLSFVFKGEGGKTEEKTATIAVDAAASPAHIDIVPEDGPHKGKTILGIIVVEADKLKLCYNLADDGKRPVDFKTAKDVLVCTFSKVKE
jgi:uncharacterized protein (TIGR03067 family)